ncbi:MAG TPA: alpha-1,6-glucosidase domain-containing protein, partial [Anaerolineales bacterium]|nr:alpha-1,6-glucosidase domain-containing protein [Anaerolineales bacterium]
DPVFANKEFELHAIQQASSDPLTRESSFDSASGEFSVPARTTAVFNITREPVVEITPTVIVETAAPSNTNIVPTALGVVGALIAGAIFLLALRRSGKRER